MVLQRNSAVTISGPFAFEAYYDGISIKDTYKIQITLRGSDVSDLPQVVETEGRIKRSAKKWQLPIIDLHTYPNGTACLCLSLDEHNIFPSGFTFPTFIEELVVPFFFAQSRSEETGEWPWETYSHRVLGWLEWYLDQGDLLPDARESYFSKLRRHPEWSSVEKLLKKKRGIKGHNHCLCGSKQPFRKCHPKVLKALWKIKADFSNHR